MPAMMVAVLKEIWKGMVTILNTRFIEVIIEK